MEHLEFLTGIRYMGNEFVGIVINQDNQITSFYDVDSLPTNEMKKEILEMGDIWWWESNRQIPINIFLYQEMQRFQPYIRNFVNKDVEVLFGPVTSLQTLIKKRVKKRSIQLIRRTD